MAADVTDSGTESENWDVDDDVVPHDIHEKTVYHLLTRNHELIKMQAENNKDAENLLSDCIKSANIDDSTSSFSDSGRSESHCEYKLVPSNPKKLYVTNISYRTTQNNLWEFFAQYGSVRYCQLLKDHNSKSKGRGFVTFTDVATAEYVLNLGLDDLYLDGRYLQVKPAMWKKSNQLDKKQENTSQDQLDTKQDGQSICFIDVISDDLMLEIFSYLSLKELLICERVCRKWRDLCIRRMHSMQHVSFSLLKNHFITGFKPRHFYNLVQRLSPVVQCIDLSMMHRCLGNDAVKTVAKHCQHLRSLNLSGLMITNSVLQYLANNCQHLQTILLNRCCKVSDKGLWPLFTKCHGLKEIELDENGLITGKSFRVAQDKLERLSLAKCTMLQDVALSHLSTRCKQLKSINLSFCNELSSQGIAYISQFHELEVLHLLGSHSSVSLLELCCLNKLQQLYLVGNQTVTEEFLSLLGSYCPNLRILDISDTNVRLDRVRSLCKCGQLETLKANYVTVNKIGHDLVAEGSLLRVVHLRGCQSLTAADLLYLVTVAECLQELDIHNTDVSAAEMTAHLQKLEPERRITLLADDDGDTEPFLMFEDDYDDEEANVGLDNAELYLDGDDPLFAEQFELS